MKIGIFGKTLEDNYLPYLSILFQELEKRKAEVWIFKPFYDKLKKLLHFDFTPKVFSNEKLEIDLDFLFSIGGDGTILDAIPYIKNSNIPIMGINLGRLGFLSSISKNEMQQAIQHIYTGNYSLDKRALIQLSKPSLFNKVNFALNDATIYRNSNKSLVAIHVYVDDLFLNTYWGDGLIVATPTGSTAYSLSVGGPIITPGSENFVIAPIASHNLTVRPVVIPDNSKIKIKVDGREERFLFTMDSRQTTIKKSDEIILEKASFKINLIQMPEHNFFSTIREKLLWGVDIRN